MDNEAANQLMITVDNVLGTTALIHINRKINSIIEISVTWSENYLLGYVDVESIQFWNFWMDTVAYE